MMEKKKSIWETPVIEKKYVHGVYDAIAPHFSSTRFAKWPKVSLFLENLPSGSLILDAGCGNGKYLGLNPKCFFLGCDLSSPLVSICSQREGKQHEVMVADTLHLPYRDGLFDGVISIAVLHHLSTEERRRKAVEEMARVVMRGGRILITVWAVEQEDKSLVCKWTPLSSKYVEEEWVGVGAIGSPSRLRTKHPAASLHRIDEHGIDICGLSDRDAIGTNALLDHGTDQIEEHNQLRTPHVIHSFENHGQSDRGVMNHSSYVGENSLSDPGTIPDVPNHGLLNSVAMPGVENQAVSDQGLMVPECGLQNCHLANQEVIECSKPIDTMEATSVEHQDFFVPWHLPFHRAEIGGASAVAVASGFARKDEKKAAVVYNRYYHVFAKGELERLVSNVDDVVIVEEFYDKSNWCVILQRV